MLLLGCGGSGDSTDGADDDSAPPDDDDALPDDDSSDDDSGDDDNDDDSGDDDDNDDDDNDDDDLHPPEISNAYWGPNPVSWDDDWDAWISYLVFYVCDIDNNLNGGGAIFAYLAGTDELIWDEPYYWNITDLCDISDCYSPCQVGAGKIFAETTEPPGWNIDYCIDLEVSDGTGLFSNKIENICVWVP